MMSEETQIQECEEASEAEEGDVEPYLAEECGPEYLERLQKLEAENSALALANESQREAYERCLDEVANHVVQALLNQKDLREECIKLKMRVFELERQNQTLSELLHQKLHSHLGPCQQMQGEPAVQHRAKTPPTGSDRPAGSTCQTSTKSDGEHMRNGAAGARGPTLSMDPLSPFLQKKAHILEVLRKLEETDPLKFHPAAGLSSYSDFSQALFSADTTTNCPGQVKVCWPFCLHSCPDSAKHDGKGEGPGAGPQSCRSCLLLAHKSLEELLARSTAPSAGGEVLDGSAQLETKVAPMPNSGGGNQPCPCSHSPASSVRATPAENGHEERCGLPWPGSANPQLHPPSREDDRNGCADGELEVELPLPEEVQSIPPPQKDRCRDGPPATLCKSLSGDPNSVTVSLGKEEKHARAVAFQSLAVGPEECFFSMAAEVAKVKNSLYAATSSLPVPGCARVAYCKREADGLSFRSGETCVIRKAGVEPEASPEKTLPAKQQPPTAGKCKLALLASSPSCLNEPKPSPISSPSRLLKFLKIPSIGDRGQAANPLRLSPQLTRSSKIPCRSNNYEVYLAPATAGKAASTTERARQPPPSSASKTDLYPVTRSTPTSQPKPEDYIAAPTNDAGYSSHLAPKASQTIGGSQPARGTQKVPHYENVSELAVPCTPHFLSEPECENPLQERRLSPPGEEGPSSLATPTGAPPCSTKPTDCGDGKEGTACYRFHSHHSLPASSAVHQSQGSFSHSHTSNSQSVTKGSEPHPTPENPQTENLLGESGHQPFQERLAALGKLKSSEDLQIGVEHAGSEEDGELESESTTSSNEEESKAMERKSEHSEEEVGHAAEFTDSPDAKPYPKSATGDDPVKLPVPSEAYEPGPGLSPLSTGGVERDTPSPRTLAMIVAESPKAKAGLLPSNPDPPQVLRNYAKRAATQNHAHNDRAVSVPHGSPSKAQCKAGQSSAQPRTVKPMQDECPTTTVINPVPQQKLLCRPEDRNKLTASRKKGFVHSESPPPPPPRPTDVALERRALSAGPQSAIEQKVMKGIEENMLKLKVQDRGQPAETKPRASNGIASWFGLRKSKLPALSRKSDTSRPKEDRKEWRLVSSSSSTSSFGSTSKTASKQKTSESESLNISKLMEKAEDLCKALEEEQAFIKGAALDRPSRGHSCEVVMNQAQGQLSVMYRGVASENFMQQLLHRVEVKDGGGDILPTHRRLSFDSKKLRPVFGQQRNGTVLPSRNREETETGAELARNDDVTTDKGLVDSLNCQHLAGCGACTHTLDSGIGTFPLPDYAGCSAGKSFPKARATEERDSPGKQGPVTKVPHKARTLDRELTSLEEVCSKQGGQNSTASYCSTPERKGVNVSRPTTIHEGPDEDTPKSSKNWTFPHLKVSAVPTEMYLGVNEEVSTGGPGSPFRRLFVTSCDRNLL